MYKLVESPQPPDDGKQHLNHNPHHLHFVSESLVEASDFALQTTIALDEVKVSKKAQDNHPILVTAHRKSHDLKAARSEHVRRWCLEDDFKLVKESGVWEPSNVRVTEGMEIDREGDDVSEVVVLDGMVDDELRVGLLDLLSPRRKNFNREIQVDRKHWRRGGYVDVARKTSSCWGLKDSGYDRLFEGSSSLTLLESRVRKWLKSIGVKGVGRVPWIVYGCDVPSIGGNAPVQGDDEPSWHVDGDPLTAPPSAFVDYYGRYGNRKEGKPRFVTMLVYLNEGWEEGWGARTEFRDTTTGIVAGTGERWKGGGLERSDS